MTRSFVAGLVFGFAIGAVAALLGALAMTAERLTHLRRRVAWWLFRREPRVDFEALQQ